MSKKQTKIKIVMRDTESIMPAPYNPREISSASFEGLKESIKKFGFVDPLIVNTRTGLLVGGHQRLKAATALGLQKVPVVEVDLSAAEEKALNVTLNNSRISGFFTDTLQQLLEEIRLEQPELMAPLMLEDLILKECSQAAPPAGEGRDEAEDDDGPTVTIKIPGVRADDKDCIVTIANEALRGTGYNAIAI